MDRSQSRTIAVLAIPLAFGLVAVAAAADTFPGFLPRPTPFPSRTPVPAPSDTPTFLPTYTATATITLTPSVTPTGPIPYTDWARDAYGPPWEVDCDDEEVENGYRLPSWALEFCVPGLITYEASWFDSPADFYGLMSSYAEGMMEAQLERHKIPEGKYLDGVALMSCGDVGKTVWLRRPGEGWEGPFIAVDCSQQNHLYYHLVGMGLVVEIGYKTVEDWGVKVLQRIDVHLGGGRPGPWNGVYYPYWWIENKLEWDKGGSP